MLMQADIEDLSVGQHEKLAQYNERGMAAMKLFRLGIGGGPQPWRVNDPPPTFQVVLRILEGEAGQHGEEANLKVFKVEQIAMCEAVHYHGFCRALPFGIVIPSLSTVPFFIWGEPQRGVQAGGVRPIGPPRACAYWHNLN
jgi:hypothetical protein